MVTTSSSLARTALIPASARVRSSYDRFGKTGGIRDALTLLNSRPGGVLTLDACDGLTRLNDAVLDEGGDLRITDCWRSVLIQANARAKYVQWDKDGRPAEGSKGFDPRIHKAAFVAYPGASFHGAGRAIDIHVDMLNFPGLPKSRQLDKFWEIALSLGWSSIIDLPTEGKPESWHFDYMGPWRATYRRVGYEAAARAANLDVGQGWDVIPLAQERFIQGQLHRAGYDCGGIDGIRGPRTNRCLSIAGIDPATPAQQIALRISRLPDSAIVLGS